MRNILQQMFGVVINEEHRWVVDLYVINKGADAHTRYPIAGDYTVNLHLTMSMQFYETFCLFWSESFIFSKIWIIIQLIMCIHIEMAIYQMMPNLDLH